MDKAMYILLNSKLTKSQRIPQSAHAAAEFMGEYGQGEDIQDWLHNHRYIICLQADEKTMREIAIGLRRAGKTRFKAFVDSDFPEDFGWTAVAFEPMEREEGREFFKDLRLA